MQFYKSYSKKKKRIFWLVILLLFSFFVIVSLALVAFDLTLGLRTKIVRFNAHPSSTSINAQIPRIFHQTWKTHELLPFQLENRRHWLQMLGPSWIASLQVDTDFDPFVKQHFTWFWSTWVLLTPFIKKVDAIRYMWLYIYGGVYADLDLMLLRPKDMKILLDTPFPNKSILITSNSSCRYFCGSNPVFMLSHPGHSFWIDMLHHIEKHHDRHVFDATGPQAMSKTLKRYLNKGKKDKKNNESVLLLSHTRYGIGPNVPFVKHICKHTNSSLWKKEYF